jgi:uncharacterized membrane protein (Fun14 family)
MSRAHERAYRLLAERVRLGDAARRALYATITALIGSGVWWIAVHYAGVFFENKPDELARLAKEALALKVHGATAFVAMFALGAMSAAHVRRGWALKRNRRIGSLLVGLFALLVVTGYALYYLVSDDTHAPVSVLHWVLGLAVGPLLVIHIATGRQSRGAAIEREPNLRRPHRSGTHHSSE